MANRTLLASSARTASAFRALLGAAIGSVVGVAACAPTVGPQSQATPAPAVTPSSSRAPAMVPASGVDNGRRSPGAGAGFPEAASEAAVQAPEKETASVPASTDEPASAAAEPTEPGGAPDRGATQDIPAEGAGEAPRSPSASLGAPSLAFMLNYQASGARKLAEEACDAKSKDDMQKRAECLQKEREAFKADVLVFDPKGKDRYTLTIYSRAGSTLKEVFASTVELKDASEQNVTMRFLGGQRGQRPIFGGRGRVTLVLATDSSLVIEDPKYGSLPYSAKVGLVQNR